MQNLHNLSRKLKRMYLAINESIDESVFNHLNFVRDPVTAQIKGFGFDGSTWNEDLDMRIMAIVHNIASLKDHLKKAIPAKEVEDTVNSSLALKLIVDIDNADKHGYPVDRPRSQLDPLIVNLQSIVKVDKGDHIKWEEKVKFEFDENGNPKVIQEIVYERFDGKVMIVGDVVDKNGNKIISFSDMVAEAISLWEGLIDKYNLS